MSRWTLNRRIYEKEIEAVRTGPRRFIPQSEIDRLLGISTAQISATKLADADPASQDGADRSKTLQDGACLTVESCKDATGNFDSKKWHDQFCQMLTMADREQKELEEDVNAGIPEASAANAACEALDRLPLKWEGPATTNSPERQRAIDAHHSTWRAWREARAKNIGSGV
jgi:hypothetical protein